jgi:hypothetical protein
MLRQFAVSASCACFFCCPHMHGCACSTWNLLVHAGKEYTQVRKEFCGRHQPVEFFQMKLGWRSERDCTLVITIYKSHGSTSAMIEVKFLVQFLQHDRRQHKTC